MFFASEDDPASNNHALFADICAPLVNDLFRKKSSTVIAYGKSIIDKNALVFGDVIFPLSEKSGFVPLTVSYIFQKLKKGFV